MITGDASFLQKPVCIAEWSDGYAGLVKLVPSLQASTRSPLLQVLKTSAAAIVAWLISTILLGQPLPIFAAIAALLIVQPSVNQSLLRGVERSVGVIAGVVLAYAVGAVFGTASWVVLSVIVVSLLVSWAFKLAPGSANQIPISAMLVLAIGAQTPQYAVNRVVETIIGAVVGLAINLLVAPPVLLRPAHLAVDRLLRETAAVMVQVAAALSERQSIADLDTLLGRARALRGLRDAAADALARGKDSLTLNPRGSRLVRVLQRDEELLARLTVLVTRVLGMTRAIHDHYDRSLAAEPAAQLICTELTRAAHDLLLLGRDAEGKEPETVTAELPALTAPILIARPNPKHWVLIGSLVEDMRRVREEIVGRSDG